MDPSMSSPPKMQDEDKDEDDFSGGCTPNVGVDSGIAGGPTNYDEDSQIKEAGIFKVICLLTHIPAYKVGNTHCILGTEDVEGATLVLWERVGEIDSGNNRPIRKYQKGDKKRPPIHKGGATPTTRTKCYKNCEADVNFNRRLARAKTESNARTACVAATAVLPEPLR